MNFQMKELLILVINNLFNKSNDNKNRFFMAHNDVIEKYEQNNKDVLH